MASFTPKVYDIADKATANPTRVLGSGSKVYFIGNSVPLTIVDYAGSLTAAQILAELQAFVNRRTPLPEAVTTTEILPTSA